MKRSLFALSGALIAPLLLSLSLGSAAHAQSNADPTIDVRLGILGNITSLGRTGTFPTGLNAAAMSTTVCNQGAIVPWMAPMDPAHPVIAFIVARLHDGRLEQISTRSHVKHGFFALTSSQCTPCTPPGGGAGNFLGLGCSDTYSTSNNGDDFWLGPADEIDPWLGEWDPVCSFFDLGTGSVTVPDDCDGVRSFTQSQANGLGNVGNRINLNDADLNVTPASYWYQGHYIVATEPEAVREDNLSSRQFTPVWNGSSWNLNESGPQLDGTVLQRWEGAQINSNTNGGDDGRVYVATVVTGPTNGLYHYEFAVHNRDNFRGVSELRIPLCAGARVLNSSFKDIDALGGNDWSATIESSGTELVFRDTSGTNALRWNSIFNFWFDSDAAPADAATTLTQADAGGGAASFAVTAMSPVQLFNVYTGDGCSLDGTPPTLFASGTSARATLGNAGFQLTSSGNGGGQINILVTTNNPGPGSFSIGGCTFWMPGPLEELYGLTTGITNGIGDLTYPLPVPNNVAFEGLTVRFQTIGTNPAGGAAFNAFDFSNGLAVRIGDSIPDCE